MQSSTRLALLLHADANGGAERVLRELAATLAARGLPLDLVLMSGHGLASPPGGVRVVELGAGRVAASVPRLARYLRRERPAALLSTLTHANVAAVAARALSRAPTRLVLSEQCLLSELGTASEHRREHLFPMAAARTYRRADAVVCSSEGLAADVARVTGLPPERIALIPNAVPAARIAEAALRAEPHPWLAAGEPPLVMAAARLERVKALDVLIEALALVRTRRPVRLVVLGEGSERPRLEALVRARGLASDVSLPGFDPNPYGLMAGAAVVALSSLREGLPTVLIEALALSRRIVASDCESGPREILAGGRYGRLVPPGDVRGFAAALEQALDDGPADVPPEALLPYHPETVADRYLDLLLPSAQSLREAA